jgi:hypothetical protein
MDKITNFKDIPQMTRMGTYEINVDWRYVSEWIEDKKDLNIDLDPDFQRSHVWSEEKQISYVEFILRGGKSSRTIYWNCPGWMGDFNGPLLLVDGKQRLQAVKSFFDNKIPVFGSFYNEYEDRLNAVNSPCFLFNVNCLKTRKEVLQWYLDLNSGGVVHTQEEIDKVKALLEQEK